MRIKHLIRHVDERQVKPETALLSVSKIYGVVPRSAVSDNPGRAEDISNYKTCQIDDLVINRMSAYQGAMGIAKQFGAISPDYMVLRMSDKVNPIYAGYLFKSHFMVSEMSSLVRGIGSVDSASVRTPRLNWSDLGNVVVDLPSVSQQQAIADFLDRETSKIDALIAKQEELIITLGERKRAELSKAVREGIYGSAMADSRYVWLGKTPKDWDTLPIWSILRIKRELVGGDWRATPLLSLTKRGIIPRDIESGKGKFPESFETYQLVEPDDLVFCHFDIEETPRTVGLVEIDGMLTGAYTRYVVINKERYDPKFLSLLFEDIDNEKRLKPFYTGLRNTMQKDRFASLRIALPSIGEQKRIVDFLERKISSVDKLASQAVSVNELLKERRQSLISAAVAGKIDLRKGA
jgi:type I restriction enzyme S subunit